MRARPVTTEALVAHLVTLVTGLDRSRRWRVAVDGAPPTAPGVLADSLVVPLRASGRPVVRASTVDFLRPASLRWEHGRHDADALYDDSIDLRALAGEVIDPFGPGGDGVYLPSLWDPELDRSTRAARRPAPPGAVLVLDGSLLLGRRLDLDLTVHLATSAAALERRTPPAERWALPAFARYVAEVDPARVADVVVRADDPRHLALQLTR